MLEDNTEDRRLLNKNLEYFNEELLPYFIVLHTAFGAIVINVQKENLKHLLGIPHSNFKLNQLRSLQFYEDLSENKYDLFDLIDENRFYNDNLLYEEELIYRKNYYFTIVFASLINAPQIHIFTNSYANDLFKTDYIHFQLEDKFGLYIGIVGDNSSNYHYFNSVLAEYDKPKKYLTGSRIKITKIERIKKEDFSPDEFKFVPSKNYHLPSSISKSNQKKTINYKSLMNAINKQISPELKITVGKYGKNSIQVYKNDDCIEQKEKLPADLTTATDIANYIKDKYD